MTELELRKQVVNTIISWINKKESDNSFKEIIDIYNSYLPHPRGYTLKLTDEWCAGTVSSVSIKNKLTEIMPIECSCSEMIRLYKEHKYSRFEESDSYVPTIGDVIFYDWEDDGILDCVNAPNHTGIVVISDGKKITVVEGNYNSSVKARTINVNGKYIRGFGLPAYHKLSEGKMTREEAKVIVKQKTGFTDETIKYIADYYRFGDEAITRLAELLKGV